MVKTTELPIKQLELNNGQIDGLPKNPRFIRSHRYEALLKSIQEFPEMLELRELIVVEFGKKYVTIGGNMRFRALSELGFDTAPCKVLPKGYAVERMREIAIKDNVGFGSDDWEALGNEWDTQELEDWGLEMPFSEPEEDEEKIPKEETGIIAISLTDDEMEQWNKAKSILNVKNDKVVLLSLVEHFFEVQNIE